MALFGGGGSTFGNRSNIPGSVLPGSAIGTTTPEKDIEVGSPPTDGVSALSWSPIADFLAVSSWDNNVRVYGVESNGSTAPKASYVHQGPVMDVCWSKDGNKILSCGADKAARLYDVSTGAQQQVAAHDAPIRNLRWIDQNGGILATGSWDKTVKVSQRLSRLSGSNPRISS